MKRPSFQFYPGDWLNDASLRSCSVGARGMWIDMLCLMHQGTPYGYLKVKDKVILPDTLARMIGASLKDVNRWLDELKSAGTFSKDSENCIFCRRMIRDETIRENRANGGKLGGNPNLKVIDKVGDKVNLNVNLKPTPSSSSSSSIINIKESIVVKPEKQVQSKLLEVEAKKHKLQLWIEEQIFDNLKKMKKQLTYEQCENIVSKYGKDKAGHELIKKILTDMDNYKILPSKYVSVNVVFTNWIEKELRSSQNGFKKPEETQRHIPQVRSKD